MKRDRDSNPTDPFAVPGVPLSPHQMDLLRRYEDLLRGEAIPRGFVASGDERRIATRHLRDSLRAAVLILARDRRAYDLGSGAGLPGIPVAIARAELEVTLVESSRRRGAFLELVAESLPLPNVRVAVARAEALTAEVDVCLARAFAPLDRAWETARPLLRRGGRLIYFAGARHLERPVMPEGHARIVARGERIVARGAQAQSPPNELATGGALVIITRQ